MMTHLPTPYYQDASCTIYCADCREILPLLPKVDLVLTDPPYGMNALDGSRTTRRYGLNRRQNWDCKPPSQEQMCVVVGAGARVIIWGLNYFMQLLPPCKGFLIWTKPHVEHLETRSCAELAWTNLTKPAKRYSCRSDEDPVHPTQKPIQLMRWCISLVPDAQTILDPFMGSGTTLRAAKDLGRRAIGIEISEEYCAIAKQRLAHEVLAL